METKKTIYEDFLNFQKNCPVIKMNSKVKVKTKTGGEYSFNYADLPKIHEITKPILHENNLFFIQTFEVHNIKTLLIHISGEKFESSFDISDYLKNSDPQSAGSVITYFKRYCLSAILGLVTEEDDDGNLGAGNTATKQPPAKPYTNDTEKTPAPAKKWLYETDKDGNETSHWKNVLSGIESGKIKSISDVEQYYSLSKISLQKLEVIIQMKNENKPI